MCNTIIFVTINVFKIFKIKLRDFRNCEPPDFFQHKQAFNRTPVLAFVFGSKSICIFFKMVYSFMIQFCYVMLIRKACQATFECI